MTLSVHDETPVPFEGHDDDDDEMPKDKTKNMVGQLNQLIFDRIR